MPSCQAIPISSARHRSLSQSNSAKAQCVGDDGYGTQSHRGTGDHGIQQNSEEGKEHTCSDRHTDSVVDKRQEQILANVFHRGTAQGAGSANASKVTAEQRNSGALHGDISAASMAIPT